MANLAVVIPVYRSTETVKELIEEIKQSWADRGQCHIFLVDDGNTPSVVSYLIQHCLQEHVTLISLKKNSGQQAAVLCGLRHCKGYDYVAVMDDDKANPAALLPVMFDKLQDGNDLVYGIAEHSGGYSFGRKCRDVLFRLCLRCPKGKRVSGFRMMRGALAEKVTEWKKEFFYFSASALLFTQKVENVFYAPVVDNRRSSGYTLWKRCKLFLNIIWYYCLPLATESDSVCMYEEARQYPSIMVLGGSQCQLHALQRAKKEQMYTVLADYTKAPAGAAVADVHEPVSTFDWEACIEAAKRHGIQGVMTIGTDQPVYTAAKVSEALSLPSCLTPEQAFLVTNKKAMKQRLMEAELPTAAWLLVDETTSAAEIGRLRPPYVIKPLDSQGQRGIFKLDTPEEVLSHLAETLKFSRCKEALVEEYYESDEMTVSGYISGGKLITLTVTDRLHYPDPVHIGVCTGHRFPTIHMDAYEEIAAVSEAIVRAFELPEGPFYLQLFLGADGIYVNELACRIGGAFEDVTIPVVTGFDLLDAVMKNMLGRPVDATAWSDFRCDRVNQAFAVQLMFCHPGKIVSVTSPEELMELPFVLDCGYNYKVGDVIPAMENATARFGHAVLVGTPDNIGAHIDEFYRRFRVIGEDGTNMVNRMYPER